ncbi:MAG: hypothetical protein OXT67_09820 [Zetaproteobacteria bacterium]|nr:hypothetical protein [Zetaproteobacteria bacterium]
MYSQFFKVAQLDEPALQKLIHVLVAIDTQVFTSTLQGKHYLAKLLTRMPHSQSKDRVIVYYDQDHQPIGFNFILMEKMKSGKRSIYICRPIATFLPQRIGNQSTMFDAIAAMVRFKLAHPHQQVYFLSFFASPFAYHLFASRYPALDLQRRPLSPKLHQLMQSCMQKWGLHNLAQQQGLYIIHSDALKISLQNLEKSKHTRFFIRVNPGFQEGQSLGCIAPITYPNLCVGTIQQVKHLFYRKQHKWKRLRYIFPLHKTKSLF